MLKKNNNIDLVHKEFNQLKRLQNIISKSVLYTTSDIDAKITSVSKAFQELTGYTEEELLGKSHSIFRDPETPDEFYKNMWSILDKNEKFVGELKNFGKNKEVFWIKITIDPMFDDNNNKIGYASYRENITNTKKLEYISTHDTLTNIYNRAFFNDTIKTKIKSAQRYGIEFSLIIIDIDHFKKVNDQHGHTKGDKVLIETAKILKNNVREDDIVARWGGEEFVILLSHTKIDGTYQLAEKLRHIIENTIFIENLKITASFGMGSYNKKLSKTEFFEKVDNSLYKAKANGRNCISKA